MRFKFCKDIAWPWQVVWGVCVFNPLLNWSGVASVPYPLRVFLITYVMRSRGISQKSNMWHFQFSNWLKSSLQFAANHTQIKPVVPKLKQLKDSLNNRKQKKCIPFSGCVSQINNPDLRLIPLDRNKYYLFKDQRACHIDINIILIIWLQISENYMPQMYLYYGARGKIFCN